MRTWEPSSLTSTSWQAPNGRELQVDSTEAPEFCEIPQGRVLVLVPDLMFTEQYPGVEPDDTG